MSLTLAFELAAARRLAAPEGAVSDARTWSENVGLVTDKPPYVLTKFTRDNYIRNDFEPATEPAAETLGHLLEHFETDRFVFVAADARTAPNGWEYRHIGTAADEADWELVDEVDQEDDDDTGAHASRERDDWP
ncbi:DUF7124 domain-containing protein [Natronomonas amylolytica]|uniref:DUF7124 domain-containing protein n=1 Tax=Natronomonas amylolytica TaxID=3108498 RepID=UPI00300B3152